MSRDWQQDMERVNNFKHAMTLVNGIKPMFHGQSPLLDDPDVLVIEYWLQQYAAEKERADRNEYAHSQIAVMTDNWAYEKERADRLQAELREYVEDNWKAFEREQKLREVIEEALSWTWNCGEDNMNEVITILKTAISSLYPLPEKEIGI